MSKSIRIGDQVRALDRIYSGKVIEVRSYTGMGDKLYVQLHPPHHGRLLLAAELWQRIR